MTANNYDFIIREAQPADDAALRRLAALDGIAAYPEEAGRGRVPRGRLIVAEADGRLVAAAPLSGGPAIADPFRQNAGVVSLLGLRAAQLRGLADRRAAGARGRGRVVPVAGAGSGRTSAVPVRKAAAAA
jgi:hypothetical protein